MTNAYNDTTEESESDVGEGIVLQRRNAFGEPCAKQVDITDLQDLKNYWKKGKKLQCAKVNAF